MLAECLRSEMKRREYTVQVANGAGHLDSDAFSLASISLRFLPFQFVYTICEHNVLLTIE